MRTVNGHNALDGGGRLRGVLTEDDHPVREVQCLFHIVGDQQNRGRVLTVHVQQQILHVDAGQRVQSTEGLVEQQHAGVACERSRQGHALSHTA